MLTRVTSLVIVFVFCVGVAFSQTQLNISGSITDALTGEPLPYASVGLKKNLSGTVSNEWGQFDFMLPEGVAEDTLVINNFGYRRFAILLSQVRAPLEIKLSPSPVQLQEVDVVPRSPEYYITMAMRGLKKNYPNKPFESLAYYREKVLENKAFVKMDEGVFKTYCPNFQDTVANQDQLLLFRTVDDIRDLAFMSKERKKDEEKNKKRVAKGDKPKDNNLEIDLASSFGGPASVLKNCRISKNNAHFLDTAKLDEYRYSFAKQSHYDQGGFLVIDFKSKGKVDHVRESGKIYIDPYTSAIVKIEKSGDFVIPVLIRPILFMYGFGVENPSFKSQTEFQLVDDRWYPRSIIENIDVDLTRRHMFSKNEHALFEVEQVYVVNKLKVEEPKQIVNVNKFVPSKPMKDQVRNDVGLKWDHVNVLKK